MLCYFSSEYLANSLYKVRSLSMTYNSNIYAVSNFFTVVLWLFFSCFFNVYTLFLWGKKCLRLEACFLGFFPAKTRSYDTVKSKELVLKKVQDKHF